MFDGFLAYDGAPIINTRMTQALADAAGAGWVQACTDCEQWPASVPTAVTDAPWYDPAFAQLSSQFFGLLPTSISPFLSSRAIRNVVPLARGGASIGRQYEQHREIVVAATLVGASREAVVYGIEWLNNVLSYGRLCGESARDRTGFDIEAWLWCDSDRNGRQRRFLYEAHATEGPTVLRETDLNNCGGSIIDVEFTITCANPGIYGAPIAFGALQQGQAKDLYTDLLHLGLDGQPLPGNGRTYDDVLDLVREDATTYSEVLAALIYYSAGIAVDSNVQPEVTL